MAVSQGNGGRTSGATIAQIPGFNADDDTFEVSARGRKAAPIPGLEPALLQMLRIGKGTFTHTSNGVSGDTTFQNKAKAMVAKWVKDLGLEENAISCQFSAVVTEGDNKTRKVRLVVSQEAREKIEKAELDLAIVGA